VPRWVIIIIILVMYARLYWILRKSHKSFISLGNSTSDPASGHRTTQGAMRSNHDAWRYHESDVAGSKGLKLLSLGAS
jgi:hypothetical protein